MSHKKTSKTSQTTEHAIITGYILYTQNKLYSNNMSYHHLKHVLKNHNIYIVYVHVHVFDKWFSVCTCKCTCTCKQAYDTHTCTCTFMCIVWLFDKWFSVCT